MTKSQYSRTKNTGSEECVFDPKHNVLFSKGQWSYLKRHYRLTDRELQVGKLVCQSYTNREIAEILEIKPGTVKTHLLNIYRKSHVTNKITLLLTFVNAVSKSSVKSVVISAIPVVDVQKPATEHSDSVQIFQKSK